MANGYTTIRINELDAIEQFDENSLFLVQNGEQESNSITYGNLRNAISTNLAGGFIAGPGLSIDATTENGGKVKFSLDSIIYSKDRAYDRGMLVAYQAEDGSWQLRLITNYVNIGESTDGKCIILFNSAQNGPQYATATEPGIIGISYTGTKNAPITQGFNIADGVLTLKYDNTDFSINDDGEFTLNTRVTVSNEFVLQPDKWADREQTVQVGNNYKITNRNVIDISPLSMEEWSLCGVYAVTETPSTVTEKEDGTKEYTEGTITFKYIYEAPSSTLKFRLTSMFVDEGLGDNLQEEE